MTNGDRFVLGFVCMMLCVILPLVMLMRREKLTKTYEVLSILVIYAVWYLTNVTFHEGSHYLGCMLTGVEITEVRLIPHVWQGDLVAYVHTPKMTWGQGAVSLPAPYVLDVVSLLIGVVLLRASGRKGPFLTAMLFMLFCLRPLFDITSNFAGFVVWNQGDFKEMTALFGGAAVYGAGVALSGIALGAVGYLLMRGRRSGPQSAARNEGPLSEGD